MARKVILVGGLFGSNLVFDAGPRQNQEVWYDQAFLATNGPDAMHLAGNGIDPGSLTDGTPLADGGLLQTIGNYKAMADRLDAEDWRVYPFSCDWRKDMGTNATKLVDQIQFFADDDDFWVLGYSAGGLLARLAYPTYKSRVLTDRWKRTLYVSTPHFGSHAATLGLAAPEASAPLPGVMLERIATAFLSSIGGRKRGGLVKRLKQVVASWPGLYQLLPAISAGWVQTRPLDSQVYNAASYAGDNDFVDQAHLNRAQVVRVAIDNTLTQPRAPEVNVIGNAILTPDRLASVEKIAKRSGYIETFAGDGVVTVQRATLPGANTLLIAESPHTATLGDRRLLSRVTDLLVNGLGVTEETPRPTETVAEDGPLKDPVVPAPKPWPDYPKVNDP